MAAIFISHSSRDNLLAGEVKAWLADLGYDQVFLDFDKDTGLGVGQEWERQLYEAIGRCHAVVLIVTPAWMDSKWCFVEFTQARALGKIIFPLVVTPDDQTIIGPPLRTIQMERWDKAGQDHLARRLKGVAEEIARGHRWDPARPPWPGIMAFEREDAAVFFGRDAEIRKVSEVLEARRAQGGARLVLMVGASGSGKSSVLKAGVLPYLARDRQRFVILPPFRPGRTPLTTFAKTLAEALDRPADFAALHADLSVADPRTALARQVDALTIGPAREATVLISIDQFEELFTIARDVERDAFLRLLSVATDQSQPLPILIVATIRSDLLSEILKAKGFAVAHDVFTLGSLPTDQLASVIEGPAQVAAIHLEDGLVERILADVGATREALPLLAFTLRELHQRFGADKKLGILEYEALGDSGQNLRPLENAVRRTAEETLAAEAPSPEESEALREAFVGHLVRVNEDGVRLRRPARLDAIPAQARRLIDRLVAVRLLAIRSEDGDNAVEVAHEALFKAWPQLAKWLDEEQNFLIGRRQIEEAERVWAATPPEQKQKALLSGLLLDKARDWALTHPQRLRSVHEFVSASIRKDDLDRAAARKRQLAVTWGSLAAAVIFACLGGWAWTQTEEAWAQERAAQEQKQIATQQRERATQEAERALAANKTIRVVQRLARHTGDTSAAPQRNLLLGVELARLRQEDSVGLSLSAVDAVRQQLRQSGGLPLTGHLKATRVAAFAPTGHRLATGSDDGMVRLWDVSKADLKSIELVSGGARITGLAFTPEGRWLFAGDGSGTIRSWKVDDAGRAFATSNPGLGAINVLAADPRGRWIAFGTESGNVCIWKLGEQGFIEGPCQQYGQAVGHLKFSARGRWLAAGSGGERAPVALWDLSEGSQLESFERLLPVEVPQEPFLRAVGFSGDETRLAVAYGYHAEVWDLTQRSPPEHVVARGSHSQWISAAALSPDGHWLVTAASEGRTKLWEVGGAKDPVLLDGHTAPVTSVAFSDDGKWLATSSQDTTARLWDLHGPRTIPGIVLRGQDLPIANAIFGPAKGALTLVTVGADQHARLWKIADRFADPTVLIKHDSYTVSAAYSADGAWIVGGDHAAKQLSVRASGDPDAPTRKLSLPAPVKAVSLSPGRRWLAAVLYDNRTLHLWRLPNLETAIELQMNGAPGDVSLGFSPDGRWLVAGTWDGGFVHVWDVSGERPSPAKRSCRHTAGVRGMAFTADSRYAVTGGHSRENRPSEVRIWDLQAADPCDAPRVLPAGHDAIPRVAISSDGRWAAAVSFDKKAILWDLSASNGLTQPLEVTLNDRGTAVAFSADHRWVAFGDSTGLAAVINLRASGPSTPVIFTGHSGRTNSVAFTPDSRMLVTSGEDRVIRLWNPADLLEAPVVLRGHDGTVQIAGISSDSRLLSTYDDSGTILLWHLSLPDLTALACRAAGRQLTKQELRDLPDADPAKLPCLDQPKLTE